MKYSKNYCEKHPPLEKTWRCVECGKEFCERCVISPRECFYLGYEHSFRTAICPECKGRCEDLKFHAEKLQHLQAEAKKIKRKTIIRYTLFILSTIPFVLEVIRWLPPLFTTELKFLLLLIGAFWFGPLRNIDLAYKLGSLIYFGGLANPLLVTVVLLFGRASSEMGYLVFKTPIKYLAESILIVVVFFVVDKISDFISRIYYSKARPVSKLRVKDWVLSIFIITLIFGVIKLTTKPPEDEVTQIKKLTCRIAEEMAKKDIDRSKVAKLDGALEEKLKNLNPERRGNEAEGMLNSLLEPYRTLTLDEAWQHFERGREKLGYDMVQIRYIKTNIFDREFKNYKTVGEVIEKGEPFLKYYLFAHIRYAPLTCLNDEN